MSGQHRRIGDQYPDDYELQENPMNLRREPAVLWLGLLAPTVQALAAFVFAADPVLQGAINAAAIAIAGAVTAFLVKSDNLLPAITGAVGALIALVLAFGVDWSSEQQAALMIAVGAIAAYIVRDRVTAPVPAPTVNA
jgi:hypothetical protein